MDKGMLPKNLKLQHLTKSENHNLNKENNMLDSDKLFKLIKKMNIYNTNSNKISWITSKKTSLLT